MQKMKIKTGNIIVSLSMIIFFNGCNDFKVMCILCVFCFFFRKTLASQQFPFTEVQLFSSYCFRTGIIIYSLCVLTLKLHFADHP